MDRMPSLGDPDMRHGRKSRTPPFTGYKRHVIKALGPDLILGATVRPANEAEHLTLPTSLPTVLTQGPLTELFPDRGYLESPAIATPHAGGTAIRSKAWTSHNGGRYPKQAFTIDLAQHRVTCLAQRGFRSGPARTTSSFRPRCATPVPNVRPARSARRGAVGRSRCIPKRRCCKTSGSPCGRPRAAPSSVNAPGSNTAWHGSAASRARKRGTKASAKTRSMYADAPRSPISNRCRD